jgi:hypothetical protein
MTARSPLWRSGVVVSVGALAGITGARPQDHEWAPPHTIPTPKPPIIDAAARKVELPHDAFRQQFGPDRPPTGEFSLADQLETYKKWPIETQQPFYLWGREMYASGPLRDYPNFMGDMNPSQPHLMVYGDARTAAGFSAVDDVDQARIATRLNVDVDLKLTATERIHAFIRPFDKGGKVMSADVLIDEDDDDDDDELFENGNQDFVFDGNLDTLFFEGDLGPMLQGFTGQRNDLDLPFAFGLMPLLFQNGVWLEDAFVGAAATIQAKNSGALQIANMDLTFFVGVDDVSNAGVARALQQGGKVPSEGGTKLVGMAGFVEVAEGYAEFGAGALINDDVNADGDDADHLNFTAAWSKRYFHCISNSVRVIANVGQDIEDDETADGLLLLCENSFGTRKPYTLVPYLNMFAGFGTPQSLARAADAGGVLKNTGINFEADALTAFPALDATAEDSIGAALGVEILPDLFTAKHRQQIVLEIAAQTSSADQIEDQFAAGIRYQFVINNSWIFRSDAMAGVLDDVDIAGFRIEVRKKW